MDVSVEPSLRDDDTGSAFAVISSQLSKFKRVKFLLKDIKLHPRLYWKDVSATGDLWLLREVARAVFGFPNGMGTTENDVGCSGRMRTVSRTSLKDSNVDMTQVVSRNGDLMDIAQVPILTKDEAKLRVPKSPEEAGELSSGVSSFKSWFSELELEFPAGMGAEVEELLENILECDVQEEGGEEDIDIMTASDTYANQHVVTSA